MEMNPFPTNGNTALAVRPQNENALVEVEQQRAIAEVQSAIILAKRFPRNQIEAMDRILVACQRPTLAEQALYSYSRGGSDITGPSIPKAFGLKGLIGGNEQGMLPLASATGIDIMSINLLMKNETDPVIWRGPIIGNVVKQFWTDVIWKNIDFMFIDMPPGTGDVPLTVFQSLPVDGIVVVASPQELVSMIVSKAVNMAKMMNIPILGLVENMSYFRCPDNGKDYKIFGESHIDAVAESYGLPVLAKLPIEPALAEACDAGTIESASGDWMAGAVDVLVKII